MNEFTFFWRPWKEDNGFLSNWFISPFTINDIKYNCVEQYIMSSKAEIFRDKEIKDKIMATKDPRKQKALAKEIEDFDEDVWNEHKIQILYEAVYAKFSQNNELKKLLLETNNSILAEASPYDKVYGIGLSKDDKRAREVEKWKGSNILGNTLMQVRGEI